MTVHMFTKGDANVPSSRQRAYLLADFLEQHGIDPIVHRPSTTELSLTPWPAKGKKILEIIKALLSVRPGDSIFLQRTVYNKYFLALLLIYRMFFRRRIVFDFDDAIYLHLPFRTKLLTRLADVVTTGNHTLLSWAREYSSHAVLLPTCTPFTLPAAKNFYDGKNGKRFRIGWVGNAEAHYENMVLMREILVELGTTGGAYTFILLGARGSPRVHALFTAIPGVVIELHDGVPPEKVPEFMDTFDVGVMPLVDSLWNRGKSALKVVEYMASGIPAIASPVGENSHVITHGVDGFLPESVQEWGRYIEALRLHPELLPRMGIKAREKVEQSYTFESQIPILMKIFC